MSSRRLHSATLAVMVLLTALLTGCASTPAGVSDYDPIEPVNRKVYGFNNALDRHVLKPVADTYIRVTPQPARTAFAHFFDNVAYLNVILNDFLQGKVKQGFSDSGRFVINTTIGVLGLFDPATGMGLPAHDEDLGQTFAVWGTPQGAYLVLPFFGPDTVRDTPNLGLATVTNLLFYIGNPWVSIPLGVLDVISTRAQANASLEMVQQAALDPYIFVREGYLQHRQYLIFDGNPPPQLFEQFNDGLTLPGQGLPPPGQSGMKQAPNAPAER
ncbi:MAG TPA: VacJ family lipoprotein [Burkholderiales bacterium]|jgi:phospholipid-binding lipoprotein MlaA|nr:VacJ family lipoprotein [Burkholderiales bacterium]